MFNLMLNENFMLYTQNMPPEHFKMLVGWLYFFAAENYWPSDEEWENAPNDVCWVFNKYTEYISRCKMRYEERIYSNILEDFDNNNDNNNDEDENGN